MAYIFRIEDQNGDGCYTFGCIKELQKHNGLKDKKHPIPQNDKGINREIKYGEEFCGFLNLDQVINWFTQKELLLLQQDGFYLKRLKVKKITARGQHQILFTN